VSLAEAVDYRLLLGILSSALGSLHLARGEPDAARPWMERAEALVRASGDALALASLLVRRVALERVAGDLAAAGGALDEAERLAERFGVLPHASLARAITAARASLAADGSAG
jgi:ATP/maltotriose-dependent transcriptional regulator MalT